MHTTVTIIGAGQAGLAMSHCLSERSIDHLVLERSEVANSWRTERWNSLRLLTPNWLSRLPGWTYRGDDPHGYMTASELVGFLEGYRLAIGAPVETNSTVLSVTATNLGYRVATEHGPVSCRAVVVAAGACSTPKIPSIASELSSQIRQLAPIHYRHPGDVEDGRVLVVGASASGVQLAEELARSGRDVALAVGQHTRLPRTYRGMDIHWWMDAMGLLDTRFDEVDDIAKARRLPSLQLVGSPEHRTLDLNALTDIGVELVGRLVGVNGGHAQFSGSLANTCADADLKMGRSVGPDRRVRSPSWPRSGPGRRRPTPTDTGSHPANQRHAFGLLNRRLGHRVQAQLSVARGQTPRSQRGDHSRWRRHDPAGTVRARPSVHSPPQVELPRRRRPGCSSSHQPPRCLSSRQCDARHWSEAAEHEPSGVAPGLSS